jgi:3-phosphoinositide dependent protein kinase-1
MRENKVGTAHAEKNALTKLGGPKSHPGIIKLQWTFQDEWSLCEAMLSTHNNRLTNLPILADFVLDLAPNGDLQSRISRLGSFSVECTRFYMAQVIDALQWMHSKGVLHRYQLSTNSKPYCFKPTL